MCLASKWDQLRKIAIAFEAGYDPVLELDSTGEAAREEQDRLEAEHELEDFPHNDAHLRRTQQELIDQIVDGHHSITGAYYLIMGPKGAFVYGQPQ